MNGRARLLTRACTTGWGDWIHGELWLSPSSLVRRRLGFTATVANGKGPTVAGPLPEADVTEAAAEQIRAEHRTNKVLSLADIASVRIHRGFVSDRLGLRMKDGAQHKLLWLSVDPAYDVLVDELAPWLQRP